MELLTQAQGAPLFPRSLRKGWETTEESDVDCHPEAESLASDSQRRTWTRACLGVSVLPEDSPLPAPGGSGGPTIYLPQLGAVTLRTQSLSAMAMLQQLIGR
jgi:hypothetical protein